MCAWAPVRDDDEPRARAGRARRRARDVRRAAHARGGRRSSSETFYSSLCEAVCRLTSMDRAVIFRYDEAHRRVRAAGAFGLDLERFAHSHVTVESAPIARQALEEDRVIEMDAEAVAREVPEALPRPARRLDARLRAAVGGRALERRDPRRPAPAPAADRGGARPAVDARQDLRARRGGAPRDVPAGPRAPAAGADRPRARGARGRDPAAVRRAAGRLERRAAARRGARARDRRAAGRPARPAPRAAAPARAGRRARRETTLVEEVTRLREAHPDLGIVLAAGQRGRRRAARSSSRSPSPCSSRRCATRASTRSRRGSR